MKKKPWYPYFAYRAGREIRNHTLTNRGIIVLVAWIVLVPFGIPVLNESRENPVEQRNAEVLLIDESTQNVALSLDNRVRENASEPGLEAVEGTMHIQLFEKEREVDPADEKTKPKFTEKPVSTVSERLVSRSSAGLAYNEELSQAVTEYAKQFTGVAYVYGGSTPTGFDCSGFTRFIYMKFKMKLPRSSHAYANVGEEVSRSDIRPGDLLLFDRYDSNLPGHVGIYLGDDEFIHASTSMGEVVIMSFSKYNGNFLEARRVIH